MQDKLAVFTVLSVNSLAVGVLDNGSVTGEAVKSVQQLSGNKHKEVSHDSAADVTHSSASLNERTSSTRTFLKQQHRRAPAVPEPAASPWYSSNELPVASSQSRTQSCSTAATSEVKHHCTTDQTPTRETTLTLQSISLESLSMTLCQSRSWPVTLLSSSVNMAPSCSVTQSNCRRLTLLSRADLSASFWWKRRR